MLAYRIDEVEEDESFRPHQGIIFLTLSLKPQVFTDRKMQKMAEIAKPTQKAL